MQNGERRTTFQSRMQLEKVLWEMHPRKTKKRKNSQPLLSLHYGMSLHMRSHLQLGIKDTLIKQANFGMHPPLSTTTWKRQSPRILINTLILQRSTSSWGGGISGLWEINAGADLPFYCPVPLLKATLIWDGSFIWRTLHGRAGWDWIRIESKRKTFQLLSWICGLCGWEKTAVQSWKVLHYFLKIVHTHATMISHSAESLQL